MPASLYVCLAAPERVGAQSLQATFGGETPAVCTTPRHTLQYRLKQELRGWVDYNILPSTARLSSPDTHPDGDSLSERDSPPERDHLHIPCESQSETHRWSWVSPCRQTMAEEEGRGQLFRAIFAPASRLLPSRPPPRPASSANADQPARPGRPSSSAEPTSRDPPTSRRPGPGPLLASGRPSRLV